MISIECTGRTLVATFVMVALLAIPGVAQTGPVSPQQPTGPKSPVKPPARDGLPSVPVIDSSDRIRGRALLPAPRETRLLLDNRTTGRITVQGWDQDVIEARALSERGEEIVIFSQQLIGERRHIFLKADYANLSGTDSPTAVVDSAPGSKDGLLEVHLEVNVPRHVELEPIKVIRSEVQVSRVDSRVAVFGRVSSVILKDVGPAEVHTRSGNIEVDKANGLVEATSGTGAIRITNSRGGVKINSIAGPVVVRCQTGRAEIETAQGPIDLEGIAGDVEAMAALSTVRFSGRLQPEGRYRLKTLSGRVEMLLPENIEGFDATLVTYRGMIETDFQLANRQTIEEPNAHRRVTGRYGKGSPQITLDSFEGVVKLSKIGSEMIVKCR